MWAIKTLEFQFRFEGTFYPCIKIMLMLYQVQQTLVILKDLKMDSYDATQTSGIWIFSACNLIVALTTCAIGFVTENIYKT